MYFGILEWLLRIGITVLVCFIFGFIFGFAYAMSEYQEGLRKKVRKLENWKNATLTLFHPVLKDGENTGLEGGYLPKFKRTKHLRSLLKNKSGSQDKVKPQFKIINKGNPEDA